MAESKKHIARVEEKVEFADGVVRTIQPLTIKSLREFVKIIEGLDLGESETISDETFQKMVDASFIVLHQTDKEIKVTDVEDIVDLDTFQKLMSVAMGNRLNSPNLVAVEE